MTLEEENRLLRYKLSPLEDKKFTEQLIPLFLLVDLERYRRRFRGTEHYVLRALEIWHECFRTKPTGADLTKLGRSLQALLWERSALNGETIFVKQVTEHEQIPTLAARS